jgi:hypothetical protein
MSIQITSNEKQKTFERVNETAGGGKLEVVNGKTYKKCIDFPCYNKELVNAILDTYVKVGVVYSSSNSVAVAQKVQNQIIADYLHQNNSISSDATQGRIQAVLVAYNAIKNNSNATTSNTNTSTSSNSTSSTKSNTLTNTSQTATSNIPTTPAMAEETAEESFFAKYKVPLILAAGIALGVIFLKLGK